MDLHFFMLPLYAIFFHLLMYLMFGLKKKHGTRNLPPGPKGMPVIGNLHELGSLPHRSLARLSQQYGPIMFLQLGSIPTIVISSDDMAREVFRNQDRAFAGRLVMRAANKVSYNCSDITFSPYGDSWRNLRRIAILELLSTKRVQSFHKVRKEEVKFMIDTIAAAAASGPVNLTDAAVLLTNNIISRVSFGKRCYTEGDRGRSKFQEAIEEIQHALGGFSVADLFPWMSWFNKLNGLEAKINKYFRELDVLFDEIIEEHKDSERPKTEHEDLVDVLLRVQKDEIALTNERIKGVLTDMFNAGTDTSATTLVWTMTELIRNPNIMRKARDEVIEAANGKSILEESDLSKLVYVKSIIKETLRLHNPLPLLVPKETTEDCKINGYEIPAKTAVIVNAFAISLDPKCWENPNKFMPEIFLTNSVDFRGQNFEFIPFGAGRRGCPGINFAIPVIELAIANLLKCFHWSTPHGMTIEDVDMEEQFGLTTPKKTPLHLVATPTDL